MAASYAFRQQCPSCEALVPIKDKSMVGKKVDCPKCKYRFVVQDPIATDKAAVGNGVKKAAAPQAKVKKTETAITAPRKPAAPAPAKAPPPKKAPPRPADEDEELDEITEDDAIDDEAGAPVKTKANGKAAPVKGKPAARPPADEEEDEDAEDEDEDEEEAKSAKDKGKGAKDKVKKAGKKGAKAGGDGKANKFASLQKLMENRKLVVGVGLAAVGVVLLGVAAWWGGIFGGSGSAKKNSTAQFTPNPGQNGQPGGEQPKDDKKDGEPKQEPGQNAGAAEAAGPALTNLLHPASDYVAHYNFKDLLGGNSPLARAAFQTPGAFTEADLRKKLGFNVRAVDDLLRGENYRYKWAFNVLHSTEPLDEQALVAALGLKAAAGSPVNKHKVYQVAPRNVPWLAQLAHLSLTPRAWRGAAANSNEPLLVHLHDGHTVIIGDPRPVLDFLNADGKFTPQSEAPPPQAAGANPGQPQFPPGFQPPPGVKLPPGFQPPGGGPQQPPQQPGGNNTGQPQFPPGFQPPPGFKMPNAPGQPGKQPGPQPGGQPVVGFRATYMTINPRLKAMLDRMEAASDKSTVLFSAVTDLDAARKGDAAIQGQLARLRQMWDVMPLVAQEKKNAAHVLWVALLKKNERTYRFHNELDCGGEAEANVLRTDLLDSAAPKVVTFFKDVFDHAIAIDRQAPAGAQPRQPGQPGGFQPPGGFRPPQNPGGFQPPAGFQPPGGFPPGGGRPGGPGTTPPKKEEVKSSRIRVVQDGKDLTFMLDVVLGGNDMPALQNAAALLALGFKGQMVVAAGLDTRFVLGQAAKALPEQGLTNRDIPPGRYPYGAFKRQGARERVAHDPDHRVGWMAGLLPFLGRDALAQRIHFDASWDAPNNWLAARAVVPEFLDPAYPLATRRIAYPGVPLDLGATHYVGIAGVGIDAADYAPDDPAVKAKLGILGYDRSLALQTVKQGRGLANTILLIEVPPPGSDNPAGMTPWMAGGGSTLRGVPEKNSIRPFVGSHGGKRGTYVVMADGSVRFVADTISDDVFKAMATVEGSAPEDFDINKEAPPVAAPQAEAPKQETKPAPPVKQEVPQPPAGAQAGQAPAPGGQQPQPAAAAPAGWKTYTSKAGGFSVLMPGQPLVQQRPLPTGGTQTTALAGGKTSVFGVTYLDLPPGRAKLPADQIFADGLKGAQANLPGGQVQSEKKISLGSHPGKEWDLFLAGKGHMLLQAFLVNGRFYTLLAGGDTLTAASPEVRTFFNSFKLLAR